VLYDAARTLERALGIRTPISRFLSAFSRAHQGRVNFIQIGANDGLRNDPVREFVIHQQWSGVLVEPLPGIFELLQRNYRRVAPGRLAFANTAIAGEGAGSGAATFWTFGPGALARVHYEKRLSYLRKSSLDREHVLRWVNHRTVFEDDIVPVRVPCMSLRRLMELHWRWGDLHLLVVDAEGYDLAILQSIDFAELTPEAIVYESENLGAGEPVARDLLEAHGYRVTALGRDSVAVREAGA
jgi:FkbM family methyltransferase